MTWLTFLSGLVFGGILLCGQSFCLSLPSAGNELQVEVIYSSYPQLITTAPRMSLTPASYLSTSPVPGLKAEPTAAV